MKNKLPGLVPVVILFLFVFGPAVTMLNAQPKKQDLARAKKLAEEGDKFFRQKNYRQAIDRYEKASAIVPRVPILYFNEGTAYYQLTEYDKAAEAFTKALDLGYKPLEVYKIRWFVYYQLKNLDAALADLQAALALQPNDYNLLIAGGDIYREKNMDKEAIAAYEKAVQINDKSPDVYYFIAFCNARLGNLPGQEAAARNAVQRNTRYLGESWFLIGSSLQRQRKYQESATAYEKAVSAQPQLVDGFNSLAQVYQVLNRLDDALGAIKRGLAANPDNGSLYTNLSWYYSLTDKYMDAVAAGKKAIQFLPDQPMGYTNLCRAYNDIKEYALAIQHCNGALKLNPNDGETNFYIARAYDFLKQEKTATGYYAKAVKGLIEFTKNNPDYSDGFYLLGGAYFAVGQIPNAISSYKQCLTLSPGFSKAIYNLGYMYVLSKDRNSARAQYEALVKTDQTLAARLLQDIQGMKN